MGSVPIELNKVNNYSYLLNLKVSGISAKSCTVLFSTCVNIDDIIALWNKIIFFKVRCLGTRSTHFEKKLLMCVIVQSAL